MRVWWPWILSCVIVAGCAGHSLDVGSNDSGVVADVEPLPTLPLGPALDAGETKQVWIGHLEKDQFPDGSKTLTMTIDFGPNGQVTGSILLGDGARLAPPTDPNVGYPPGNSGAVTLVEGFPYTILNGLLQSSHLTLQFAEYEVWTQWCALQTSYPEPCDGPGCGDAAVTGSYDCVPPFPRYPDVSLGSGPGGCGYFFPDGAISVIDCGKQLCSGVCQCSATGCRVRSSGSPIALLDLVVADTKATGGLSGPFGDDPVQFTRSQ